MLSKMIAKGILFHKRAYLRSFWNAIDCFATVYSFLEIVYPFLGKVVILRVIRLLRIIKNIKSFESIKKPINCIMLAIPTIANVLLFLGFIFTVFATLGIQLFSGAFYKRCRAQPISFYNEAAEKGLKFWADPVTRLLCNQEGFYGKCPEGTYCVNFYDIPDYFNLTEKNITIDLFDIERENISTNFYLFYAIPNFDTIINCFVNVFMIMTYQNWTDISSIVIDSNSSLMVNLYFNIIVIFGGFFIMKMIFAAQNEVFIKVKEDEQENKLLMLHNFSKANPQIAGLVDIEKLLQNINSMDTVDLFNKIEKVIMENQRMMNSLGKKDFNNNKNENKNYDKNDNNKNFGSVSNNKNEIYNDYKYENKKLRENHNSDGIQSLGIVVGSNDDNFLNEKYNFLDNENNNNLINKDYQNSNINEVNKEKIQNANIDTNLNSEIYHTNLERSKELNLKKEIKGN